MSTFGKRLDEFTENYVIDHIKVSRKFKYKDAITPEVLRVLNTYKKIGVHKMFEKLYPKAFIKQQLRINPLSGLSTSDIKSRIVTVLNNLNAWRSNGVTIDEATNRLQVLLSELGIRNISDYFNNVGVDIIKSSSSLTALYVKVNNSSYDSLITAIRAGDFNSMYNYEMDNTNYLGEKIKIDGNAATQFKRHLETAAVRYFTMAGSTIPVPTPEEEAPKIVRRTSNLKTIQNNGSSR
jgi:hypothetical protein